jgi:hypothetical protein
MKMLTFLKSFLPSDSPYLSKLDELSKNELSYAKACIQLLHSLIEQIEKGYISVSSQDTVDLSSNLNIIFSRFHRVAKQLRSRHADRSTLEIEDEYDVQDLLHVLLQLYFDDIRKEEWTPSYAGSASRQDFLL